MASAQTFVHVRRQFRPARKANPDQLSSSTFFRLRSIDEIRSYN